jgi:hypothetical protein
VAIGSPDIGLRDDRDEGPVIATLIGMSFGPNSFRVMTRSIALPTALALAVLAAACGGSSQNRSSPGSGRSTGTTPVVTTTPDAGSFDGHVIDNPWFPLVPGMTWKYRGVKNGEPSRETMVATPKTRTIEGVPCTVVSDKLYLSGVLEERTLDYYAQDKNDTV